VHDETNSTVAAEDTGIQLNPNGTGRGVFAPINGKGAAVFGRSANSDGVTENIVPLGVLLLVKASRKPGSSVLVD
jgi:hypothetical protein